MWLLPIIDRVCTTAIRIYYRFETAGEKIPDGVPLLLVANHPNGVVDAISVVAAADRPVRFLAKEPLFRHSLLGFFVRGSGSIPVYRKQDTPDGAVDNTQMFAAALQTISEGGTIGLFPEGISHDEPSLTTLKTGAARIALGAAPLTSARIAIVPIGLNIRDKDQFRSRALALIGEPIDWDDLRDRGADDFDAVRELTDRIYKRLRDVTMNLEKWEDVRLVEYAEAIWSAEKGLEREDRLETRIEMTKALATLRTNDPARIQPVVDSIEEFAALLEALELRPRHLDDEPSLAGAAWWTLRKLAQLGASIPVLASGYLVFFIPYLGVVVTDRMFDASRDIRSTIKFFAGLAFYLPWIAILTTLVWSRFGWPWGVASLVGLPLLGIATQLMRERWGFAIRVVRRFFTLRKSSLRRILLDRRAAIARDLETLRESMSG